MPRKLQLSTSADILSPGRVNDSESVIFLLKKSVKYCQLASVMARELELDAQDLIWNRPK